MFSVHRKIRSPINARLKAEQRITVRTAYAEGFSGKALQNSNHQRDTLNEEGELTTVNAECCYLSKYLQSAWNQGLWDCIRQEFNGEDGPGFEYIASEVRKKLAAALEAAPLPTYSGEIFQPKTFYIEYQASQPWPPFSMYCEKACPILEFDDTGKILARWPSPPFNSDALNQAAKEVVDDWLEKVNQPDLVVERFRNAMPHRVWKRVTTFIADVIVSVIGAICVSMVIWPTQYTSISVWEWFGGLKGTIPFGMAVIYIASDYLFDKKTLVRSLWSGLIAAFLSRLIIYSIWP